MVEFKSSNNGATIRFSVLNVYEDGTKFSVEVSTYFGTAHTKASTFFVGSPAILFQSMADEWKGWEKEKTWRDLENSVIFTARCDLTGHTEFTVKLTDYKSSFETVLMFEAGQLEEMANEIRTLLP